MSLPSSVTVPYMGVRLPVMALKKVDFPAPFGPINPVIDPLLIEIETSSTARNAPKLWVNPFVDRITSVIITPKPDPEAAYSDCTS